MSETFDFDTIIVGAGISGLAAAHRLTKAGQRIVILEQASRPGGRIARISYMGDMAEAGGQGYFDNYDDTLQLIEIYGLADDLIEKGGKTLYISERGERKIVSDNLSLLRALGVKGAWDLFRFDIKYRRHARDFPQFEISKSIPEYDDITSDQAMRWSHKRFQDYVLRPLTHMMTTSSPEGTNLYYLVNVLKQSHRKSYFLKGGNARLPERMAENLPVRYGVTVSGLVDTDGRISGVRLAEGSTISARHVILTCPAGAAGDILPASYGDAKTFLQTFPHTPYALPFFFLREPLKEDVYFYSGHPYRKACFNGALDHTVYMPAHVPSGNAVVSAWAAYPEALELAAWPDEDVIDQATADLELLIPGFSQKVAHAEVVRHHWGIARYEPGMHGRIIDFKEKTEQWLGLSVAGTDYDCPHIEGGVRSGFRAADRALKAN